MRPLAVTMGDPAGIGPDITIAAWSQRHEMDLPPFVVIADPDLLSQRADELELSIDVEPIASFDEALACFADRLPVCAIEPSMTHITAGRPDKAAAGAITGSIVKAVELIYAGDVSAIVTNPINKALLYDSGFSHPGHTEFLGALARRRGDQASPVMMLATEGLRVVPATIHIPLREVPDALTKELILETLKVLDQELKHSFAIQNPRIAVTGLNPHAGEDGKLGTEEKDIIIPAIENAQAKGLTVTGPHPADTIFHQSARSTYDAVLAMYHDQALIPLKTIAFDKGVNVTLGLPFVRTSPDHGTAYSIAGTGTAKPTSFIEALKLARLIAGNRTPSE